MKELWRVLRGRRTGFVTITAAEAVVSGVEALVHPLLLKALFDQAILAGNFRRFLLLGVVYLLVGVSLNLAGYRIACRRKRFENALVLWLEMRLLDRTLDLDARRVSEVGNASYVSRVHNDVREGVLPAIALCIRIACNAVASTVFVGVLLYLSWQAALVLLVIVPPLVFASNRLAKRIEDNTEPEREAEARYVNTLTRTLESFHALRGLRSLLPRARAANEEALRGFLGITFVNYRLARRQNTLSDLVMNLSNTTSMIIGAYFVFAGTMSFGSFLAFVNSLWRAVNGIFDLVSTIPEARRSSAVLRRIAALHGSDATRYQDEGPAVLVRGAQVGYDGATVSLEDFALDAGRHVLLRGPNGCGKTTLLHVLSGTLAPDAGLVTVPRRVASLTAPVHLPPLPVRELVADEGLRATLELGDLVDHLPSELSSGQRQRVGIAALLAEDADLYLADEPFANLDERGRDLVLRTLTERTRGRGLLVVHHGDENLDGHFDRVVTLSGTAAVPTA
ncbi:ABC transporter ATP-binding protein [Actinosynnema sp. NPDC020468]|uniref:ABC transporter ATP-binding protein n=1 Tax=Actinosynnema sp. NPDC020468 TaxID=3154488 RepID=UPI0033DEF609